MAYVYLTTPEHGLVTRIADELTQVGLAARRIRVFSVRPGELSKLPVKVIRYRSPSANISYGAGLGGLVGVLVGLPLLLAGGLGLAPVLVLVVMLGTGGALSRLWFGHGLAGELYRLDDALRHGETVVVLDVDKERVGEMERLVKERHPEVSVLGTDVEGTPPFP